MIDANKTVWISKVEEDAYGDLFIVIPEDIRKDLGWREGDTLEWIIQDDKSVILKKKSKHG